MPNLNATLEALSNEHAADVSALVDRASEAARRAYDGLASAPEGQRYNQLRAAILGAVDGARVAARDAAATHVLDELREVVTGRSVPSIAMAKDPLPSDVLEYVDNAVDAARQADEQEEGIASTSWWAERVIESEAFRTYDEARRVAEQSLRALSDEDAERYGFRVAKRESDLRSSREDPGLIPLLGKRWDAVNDSRTCEICRRKHGTLGLPGLSYDGGDPPIHARCRCVSCLWAVGYVKGLDAMSEQDTRALARYDTALDTRSIDAESRTIMGCVASDESIDSHCSIIKAKGWNLDRYNANPLLLWQHKSSGDPSDILGTSGMHVKGKQLIADLRFSPEGANPKADMVWGQIQRGEVRGISVGFRPTKYHFEKREDGEDELMVIDSAELVELSVVMIPSNPNTLIKQVRSMFEGDNDSTREAKPCECPNNCTDSAMLADEKSGTAVTTTDRDSHPLQVQQRKVVANMSDNKVTSLPAEIAAILGTTDAEEAKRLIAKDRLRIAQLEEEKERAVAESKQARVDLDKYRNEAADAAVDELIKLNLIKEANRSTAQAFARSDLAGFTGMYAEARASQAKREAPKAHLLEQVTDTKMDPKPRTMPAAEFASKHRAKVRELRTVDPRLDYALANQMALEALANEGK